MTVRQLLQSLDWTLLSAALLLTMVGFAMLVSVAGQETLFSGLFIRQAIAAGIGLVLGLLVAKMPYHRWRHYMWILYGVGVAVLVGVVLLATVIRGAASRIEVLGFQIQPSEYMKVALVLVLAWFFSQYKRIRIKQVGLSIAITAIPVALVALQPDFGVASLMVALWAGLIVFHGVSWKYIVPLILLGIVGFAGIWQWGLLDYQKDRLRTFLDPASDPLRSGYNVTQSIIALGSGQVVGRGLGQGPQSQLKFLPERHTDFVLASVGEELGFIGVTVIVFLYGILLWRLITIIRQTQGDFGQLIVTGVFLILLASFMVSAGMNMGLLPVTGIPLPFISYGGSNLIVTFILLGLAQSVHVYSTYVRRPAPEISHFI